MKELVNIGYEHLFLSAAYNDIGIYPAIVVKNGKESKRNEWEEGWNACSQAILDKQIKYMKWYEELSEERQHYAAELINSEYLLLSETKNGEVVPMLLMNDTFYYASGDVEECQPKDFACIWNLWNRHKWYGLMAWAARQRNQEPVKEWRNEQYATAVEYLNKMWPVA